MRVEWLRLRNFKCYGDAELRLGPGVTVVHGVNGSGKSTLLEAIFFALYGAKALDDRTLDDVITTGEDECTVELGFTHDGRDFHVERRLKLRGERATTTKCVLDGPEGGFEGARDVRRRITELLRMDADAFVNCAYVRQGEVNKLIHASPGARQDMIDDLLQLGALETYRERASDARLGVKTVLDGQRELLENVGQQVELRERKELNERLNTLESRRADVDERIANYEEQRERARETLEDATDVLERHEEIREEITALDAEVDELRGKVADTERDREDAKAEIGELIDRREALADERERLLATADLDGSSGAIDDRVETLETQDERLRDDLEDVRVAITERVGELERCREAVEELEAAAERARAEADELAGTLEADEEAIDDRESKLADLEAELREERERFADAPVDRGEAADHLASLEADREELTGEIGGLRADHRAVEAAIEEGERLLEEGKCPECGQPVEDSPHVDVLGERREELADLEAELAALEDDREALDERIDRAESLCEAERRIDRLEERRETAEQLLAEKRLTIADRRESRERLLEEADEHEADGDETRERIDTLEGAVAERRAELGEINRERGEIGSALESLDRIREVDAERAELSSAIEQLRERRADWRTLNEERRETLADKRDRKRELEGRSDEKRVETARTERRKAAEYIENVDAELEELRERRDELQNAIGATERELEELSELRERLDRIESRCDRLESLYGEAETLQATYGELRAELRQRNVETLERLLNETFELVYRNDSYAAIDLDGEYRLTVYQKDGEPLEPEQLSGGERALFNLSLRCAIYRLLAEGVEGAAPMPPLILDEPTVFLDSGHVTQLIALVESMRDLGVEQILLVSHDEELVGAADAVVGVEKDATSNRSRLRRGEGRAADVLASD